MDLKVYKSFLKERNMKDEDIEKAIGVVEDAEKFFNERNLAFDSVSKEELRLYLDQMIHAGKNTPDNFIALARYYYAIDNKERYIDFTAFFGSQGVLENIIERSCCQESFSEVTLPPLGTDLREMPKYTKDFMECLESNFEEGEYFKILAGNNHSIPRETMLSEKESFEELKDLDLYLKERHARKVKELKDHMEADKVWFEQIITEDVVSFVEGNQEVLSAVRMDNYLYVTKIPFDTKAFLASESDDLKKYYVCHCPFVREGLKTGDMDVNHNWCYCSAGFAKYPFEVMFDQELSVELLDTPLKGDMRCRFKIEIPENIMKEYVKD